MSSSNEFEVGQWVTCETATGFKVRGQVAKVVKDEHHGITTYTLHQFPEHAQAPVLRYWDVDWNETADPHLAQGSDTP